MSTSCRGQRVTRSALIHRIARWLLPNARIILWDQNLWKQNVHLRNSTDASHLRIFTLRRFIPFFASASNEQTREMPNLRKESQILRHNLRWQFFSSFRAFDFFRRRCVSQKWTENKIDTWMTTRQRLRHFRASNEIWQMQSRYTYTWKPLRLEWSWDGRKDDSRLCEIK